MDQLHHGEPVLLWRRSCRKKQFRIWSKIKTLEMMLRAWIKPWILAIVIGPQKKLRFKLSLTDIQFFLTFFILYFVKIDFDVESFLEPEWILNWWDGQGELPTVYKQKKKRFNWRPPKLFWFLMFCKIKTKTFQCDLFFIG